MTLYAVVWTREDGREGLWYYTLESDAQAVMLALRMRGLYDAHIEEC